MRTLLKKTEAKKTARAPTAGDLLGILGAYITERSAAAQTPGGLFFRRPHLNLAAKPKDLDGATTQLGQLSADLIDLTPEEQKTATLLDVPGLGTLARHLAPLMTVLIGLGLVLPVTPDVLLRWLGVIAPLRGIVLGAERLKVGALDMLLTVQGLESWMIDSALLWLSQQLEAAPDKDAQNKLLDAFAPLLTLLDEERARSQGQRDRLDKKEADLQKEAAASAERVAHAETLHAAKTSGAVSEADLLRAARGNADKAVELEASPRSRRQRR